MVRVRVVHLDLRAVCDCGGAGKAVTMTIKEGGRGPVKNQLGQEDYFCLWCLIKRIIRMLRKTSK